MYELSLVELESELAAELPTRNLMSRRHGRRSSGTRAHANNGSVSNANSTNQNIMNSQSAILTGVNNNGTPLQVNAGLVLQVGANRNTNSNTQFGTPLNYSAGY